MKKIYLVHCWAGTKDDGWYPWVSSQLNSEEVKVFRFNMPNATAPKIEEWVKTLNDNVCVLDEDTYFIGHSIGCQTILRYLQSKEITKIGGILFVAPWFELLVNAFNNKESINIAKPWLEKSIDFDKIKRFTENINCIFSDNDYFVALDQKQEFQDKLNTSNIVVSGKGHISQDDGVFELREIIDVCNKMLEN